MFVVCSLTTCVPVKRVFKVYHIVCCLQLGILRTCQESVLSVSYCLLSSAWHHVYQSRKCFKCIILFVVFSLASCVPVCFSGSYCLVSLAWHHVYPSRKVHCIFHIHSKYLDIQARIISVNLNQSRRIWRPTRVYTVCHSATVLNLSAGGQIDLFIFFFFFFFFEAVLLGFKLSETLINFTSLCSVFV